eukprot:2447951-Pleurochrysis_carterae.AAC.1
MQCKVSYRFACEEHNPMSYNIVKHQRSRVWPRSSHDMACRQTKKSIFTRRFQESSSTIAAAAAIL